MKKMQSLHWKRDIYNRRDMNFSVYLIISELEHSLLENVYDFVMELDLLTVKFPFSSKMFLPRSRFKHIMLLH